MNKKDKILIFGASGHAKVIIDVIEKEAKYEIVGLIDPNKDEGEEILGYKILGKEEDLANFLSITDISGGIIAIGDNWVRKKVKEEIEKNIPDFEFVSCIHPSAQIGKNVRMGPGTAVLPGAIINSSCELGSHCILNTNSSLDHDSRIDDYVSLAPNATTGSNVVIGKCSAISLGANIIQNVKIGKHCVVGASSLVLKDIEDHSLSYGVPAKAIRKRESGEKYL